jgi:hypothetical protein
MDAVAQFVVLAGSLGLSVGLARIALIAVFWLAAVVRGPDR